MTDVVLTPQQEAAAQKVEEWFNNRGGDGGKPLFVLAGYAGTGKTFTTKTIVDRLKVAPAYMAYTGKAALMMKRYSGLDAATIHSSIYRLKPVPESVFKTLVQKRDETENPEERKKIQDEIKELQKPVFELNTDALSDVDLIVLDECSMVDEDMLRDLLSFGIPILALGDPGQLPPVKGTGAIFKHPPDVTLTDIQRQAEGSPIIQWATRARKRMPLLRTYTDTVLTDPAAHISTQQVSSSLLQKLFDHHDAVLCWKNVTRMKLNTMRRRMLGYTDVFPQKGDQIVFRQNNKDLGIFNGLIAEVVETRELFDFYMNIFVRTELGQEIEVPVMQTLFSKYIEPDVESRIPPWAFRGRIQADFAYALTVHTAQGSQWPRVLLFDENTLVWKKDERAQWLYTGITRAQEKITVLNGAF